MDLKDFRKTYFNEVKMAKNKEKKMKKLDKNEVLKRLHTEYNRILNEFSLTDICDPQYSELDDMMCDIAITLRMLAIKYDIDYKDINKDLDKATSIKMERERRYIMQKFVKI